MVNIIFDASINYVKDFIKSLCRRSHNFPLVEFWEFLDIRSKRILFNKSKKCIARFMLEMRRQAAFPQFSLEIKSKSEDIHMLFRLLEQLNNEPLEITNTLK